MGAVTGDIVNLINGVSQQAAALRLPTQGELQENLYSTIVEGLKKRPPLEFLAKILDSVPANAFFHIIHRDGDEKYVVVATPTTLQVFDFNGNERTVTLEGSASAYLAAATNAQSDLRALTVADYTFICNRKVECKMNPNVIEPLRPPEALINITAGNYARSYQITVNGTLVAEYVTPDGSDKTHAAAIATTVIAVELYNDLSLNGLNDGVVWGTGIHQNAIHIRKWNNTDFTISMTDGVNGNASTLSKGVVQKFSDLPLFAPQDFVIEVGNSEGTKLDNYWVKADKGGSDQNSQVVWKECCKPGTTLEIDGDTMPHALVRNEDGSFTLRAMEWDKRKCGDGDTISPDPSFIGRTIEDLVFHRNRLGFLCDEGIVLSRSGSFFDFFRTTATTVLDDDPIDVMSTHVKVSFLYHALPHQDDLLLFSGGTQFRLGGGDTLTPKTVSIRPLTEFNCSKEVRPIANGQSSFFVSDSGTGYSSVYEYFIDKALETADADHINAHAPSYIPAGAYSLVGSPDENVLAMLTRGDPGAIFIYSYYWAKEEKLQSSWSRWSFDDKTILGARYINSDLYVIYTRAGGVYLGVIRMDPAMFDEGFGFQVALDERISSASLPAPVYDPDDNTTTYTLPFPVPQNVRAVVTAGDVLGTEVRIASVDNADLTLRGDRRGLSFFFGRPYESRYRFSTFFPRTPSQAGGSVAKQDGRLQVHHLAVVYDRSAYFTVEVQRDLHQVERHIFNGYRIGTPDSVIGHIPVTSGRLNIPILSRNDRVSIDLVNDSWLPSNFISATWRGRWTQTAREV